MRPSARLCTMLVIAAIAAGCGSSASPPTSRPLGVITLGDSSDGAGGYLTSPQAVFWDASNVSLPGSNAPPDACIDTIYFVPDTTHAVVPNQLNAGDSIPFSSTLGLGALKPDTIPNVQIVYRYHGAGFQYTPGGEHHVHDPRRVGRIRCRDDPRPHGEEAGAGAGAVASHRLVPDQLDGRCAGHGCREHLSDLRDAHLARAGPSDHLLGR